METETMFPRRGTGHMVWRGIKYMSPTRVWRRISAAYRSSRDQALLDTIGDAFAALEANKGGTLVTKALVGPKDFRRMYMSLIFRGVLDLSIGAPLIFAKKTATLKQTSVGRLWTAELFVREGMDGRIVLSSA